MLKICKLVRLDNLYMPNKRTLLIFFMFISALGFSQSRFNLPRTNYTKVKFQLIDNLIVFPVEVNGVKLSFLLDTGVSKPILFNIVNTDSLKINHVESIYLRGLGDGGYIEALKSKQNVLKIGDAININQDIYVIFDETINFTPRLGVPIHGIIGYDVFKDFIVEINYASKYLKLYKPEDYKYKKCRKCQTLDLSLVNNKPYINATAEVNSKHIPVKLLIDSGGSDALWLFEDDSLGLAPIKDEFFEDFLGKGLSGSVYGKRSIVNSFSLKDYHLKNVNVAYPDSASVSFARKHKERSGSIAGELLRRFNIIVDYTNAKVTLKKNRNFKAPFSYNKSGIILEQNGIRVVKEIDDKAVFDYGKSSENQNRIRVVESYKFALKPAFTIVELRKNSPAERAGLMIGDILLSVNGKEAHHYQMQEINGMFRDDDGKTIRLKVDRNGIVMTFEFKLESLL